MRHTLPLPLLPLLVCVVLALVAGPHSPYLAEAAEPLIEGRCRPQGILKDPPYQHPRRVTLPFCQQVNKASRVWRRICSLIHHHNNIQSNRLLPLVCLSPLFVTPTVRLQLLRCRPRPGAAASVACDCRG